MKITMWHCSSFPSVISVLDHPERAREKWTREETSQLVNQGKRALLWCDAHNFTQLQKHTSDTHRATVICHVTLL